MGEPVTHHATLVFDRTFEAPVERVFSALSDPVARAQWSAPSETAVLIYDQADFRIGGCDIFRCGTKSDPRYRGETRYCDIVPNRRIISIETIDELETLLSAALATLELTPDGERTRLKLTVQLAALGDKRMIDGTKLGYAGALDNLARFLGGRLAPPPPGDDLIER
ncbi:MAG TPA: SRPBCC family protein [Stellaceae bacterium]|nr:SRPBCC family protein [Stellaceae bacterium]